MSVLDYNERSEINETKSETNETKNETNPVEDKDFEID